MTTTRRDFIKQSAALAAAAALPPAVLAAPTCDAFTFEAWVRAAPDELWHYRAVGPVLLVEPVTLDDAGRILGLRTEWHVAELRVRRCP